MSARTRWRLSTRGIGTGQTYPPLDAGSHGRALLVSDLAHGPGAIGEVSNQRPFRGAVVDEGADVMSEWFGVSWSSLAGVVLSTAAMFAVTVLRVRLAGRRTVAQLSAFDAVVTIAIGSVIAGAILLPQASFAKGVATLVTLLFLQVTVAALRRQSPRFRRLLEFSPEVVARDGVFHLPTALLSSQLTDEELAACCANMVSSTSGDVAVAVLEANGSISVLRRSEPGGPLLP